LALNPASAEAQALVDTALANGFRWLKFPARLEHAFIQDMGPKRAVKLGIAALNSLVLCGGMLVAEQLLTPQDLLFASALRIGFYLPFVLAVLAIFRKVNQAALNEWVVPMVAWVACGITGVLAATGANGGNPLAYVKLVELLVLITYATVFARFWPMVLVIIGAVLVHTVTLLLVVDVLGTVRLGASLLLITTLSFSLYACYVREHNDRMAFLLDLREQGLRLSLKANNDRLATAARTDALTGVANRRAFDEFLSQNWARAQAESLPLALLMVDVDHFKAYNDRHGHQAGDRCLQTVAEAIGHGLRRPVDLLARWGGEEFAVLITDADAPAAGHVAQRVLEAVQACALPHGASSCAPVVTVSIGLACVRPDGQTPPSALIRLADDRLYQAKSEGRNRAAGEVPVARAQAEVAA
jgi:diguanylate cyclase (GGDEF)-like protein